MNSPGGYIYVLYGADGFSRDETLRSLKDRMRALPAGEHNITELEGAEATVEAMRLAADAMPFLCERRLVIVHGLLGRLQGRGGGGRGRKGRTASQPKGDGELEALLAYLPTVPSSTSVAFVEGAGIQPTAVAEAIPKGRGFVREFPKPENAAAWLRKRARAIEVDVDESAVRELAMLGSDDLRRLDNELRKLGSYADGRVVTREDVLELVVGRDIVIWTLLDALADRRREAALSALRRLYAQGETPEALLARDVGPLYRRLLLAQEINGLDRSERANVDYAAINLNPKSLPKLSDQARHFDVGELDRALELLLDLDRRIKSGETDPESGLEIAVVQLCSRLSVAA